MNIMYRRFEVYNFRCFKALKLNDLARVNLIAGSNNIGKTALLEALFIHAGRHNPEITLRVNAFRGIDIVKVEFGPIGETPWDPIFTDFDSLKIIKLVGVDDKNGSRTIHLRVIREPTELAKISHSVLPVKNRYKSTPLTSEISRVLELKCEEKGKVTRHFMIFSPKGPEIMPIPPPPPFKGIFLAVGTPLHSTEEAQRFGNLVRHKKEEILLNILKIIEPRLTSLALIPVGDKLVIHGDTGMGKMIPLPLLGAGMVRLTRLVLAISDAENGIVLVDEIENGIHHSVLPEIWHAIREATQQFNTQLFATTHSFECIVAAHKTFEKQEPYDFRLHRLERINGRIKAITYDKETLSAAIETELEVR